MPKPVNVRITGESGGAVSAINSTERELRQLNQTAARTDGSLATIKRGFATIGAGILAGGALREGIGLIKESVGLAATLGDTVSAAQAVFGKKSNILTWSQETNAALSLTQQQILEISSGFDTLLTNKGFRAGPAAQMSKDLTELAADLSSFFGGTAADAAQALNAALKGETDPIERFGVSLDEATLKARALKMGLYDGKGALTSNAKAAAAYAEILRQTSKAQGDLERTQGSAANQIRQFQTNVSELKTTLGQAFIPLIEEYLPGINTGLDALNNKKAAENLGKSLLAGAKVIENDLLPKVKEFASGIKDAFGKVDFDSGDAKESLDALSGAAETMAGFVGDAMRAFDGLSPQAKENIALLVAAGGALSLAKRNPVVKLSVDLVSGTLQTVAETLASRVFRGTLPVKVTNWPRTYPDGPDGGGGGTGGRGRGRQVATGIAGVAASMLLPEILDALGASGTFREQVEGISSVASMAALGFAIGGPPGAVIGGLIEAVRMLSQDNKIQYAELTKGQQRSDYLANQDKILVSKQQEQAGQIVKTTNAANTAVTSSYLAAQTAGEAVRGVGVVKKDLGTEHQERILGNRLQAEKNRKAKAALDEEQRTRVTGDRRSLKAAKDAEAEAEEADRKARNAANKAERERIARIAADVKINARITANQATVRAYFSKVERLMAGNVSYSPTVSGRTATSGVTNNYYSITVPGAGSPATTAREIDRYIRRAGDRSRVSVTP